MLMLLCCGLGFVFIFCAFSSAAFAIWDVPTSFSLSLRFKCSLALQEDKDWDQLTAKPKINYIYITFSYLYLYMSIQHKMRWTDERTTAHNKQLLHHNRLHIHYLQIFGREWKYFRPFTAIAETKRGNSIKALILFFVDFLLFIHSFLHSLQCSLLLFSFAHASWCL